MPSGPTRKHRTAGAALGGIFSLRIANATHLFRTWASRSISAATFSKQSQQQGRPSTMAPPGTPPEPKRSSKDFPQSEHCDSESGTTPDSSGRSPGLSTSQREPQKTHRKGKNSSQRERSTLTERTILRQLRHPRPETRLILTSVFTTHPLCAS